MRIPSTTAGQARFAQIPKAEIQRASFDRSHGHKTTFDADVLVPIFVDEALPGDTFRLNMTGFCRMATPIYPIMDNLYIDTHFFFVPIRLVWDNFKRFMGEQATPDASTDFLVPTNSTGATAVQVGSVGDYCGIPTGVNIQNFHVNILPFRAIALIWNEWFRDQNLQDSITVSKGDTANVGYDWTLASTMFKRGKRHDYFTSALPWPQKGDSVDLPLGTTAPVVGTGAPTFDVTTNLDIHLKGGSGAGAVPFWETNITGADGNAIWNDTQLQTDLSGATAATINQLRQAFQIQKLLERDARGGTRYTEIVRAHFGVTSPDARLQRPEYLGGGTSPIQINPVQQTSATEAGGTPQGTLAATGTATLVNHGFTQSFTEHGYVIGFASVRADLTYQQGLNRMWSRSTKYDFYWPALAHIGEQAVLNKEIYVGATLSTNNDVFGYQERFAEYRYKPSMVTGLFRSAAAGTLDSWHLAQNFGSLPLLNSDFIESNTPMDRVLAVTDEPAFIFDSYFNLNCARPMPVYGVPGLIDHF